MQKLALCSRTARDNIPPDHFASFRSVPFSEKIRVIFGFKQLAWKSVRISRIMPRPDLMPLTGGYRRTPVLQIGADIYCDTQIIVRELEVRFPTPTLFPAGHRGIPWASGMWTDRAFFQNTVNLVFGTLADKVPQDFIEDRGRLRGAKFDAAAMRAAIPQARDQFRAHLDWIEAQLSDGRDWLMGAFSLADVNAYMNVWYTRSNFSDADQKLAGLDGILPSVRTPWHGRSAFEPLDMATARKCPLARRWTSLRGPPRKRRGWPIPTIRMRGSQVTGYLLRPMTTARSRCAARSCRFRPDTSPSAATTSGSATRWRTFLAQGSSSPRLEALGSIQKMDRKGWPLTRHDQGPVLRPNPRLGCSSP